MPSGSPTSFTSRFADRAEQLFPRPGCQYGWDEIEGLWGAGCSVFIYQHFPREWRPAFAERIVGELRSRTGARFVEAFQTGHVLFLLAAQDQHSKRIGTAIPWLSDRWNGQITPMGLANKPLQPTGFVGGNRSGTL